MSIQSGKRFAAGRKGLFFQKFISFVVIYLLILQSLLFALPANAQSATAGLLVSNSIVISQFQVAGGSALDEFIELHNVSSSGVDLNGYRVVYRSASGTNDVAMVEWTSSTVIQAGGYYLIATSAYDGAVSSNITYNTGAVSMSATGGGIAIRNGALNTGTIVDSIGYGTATNVFIEGATTSAPAANASQSRGGNGCQDTDNNSNDFSTLNPSAPRNAASSPNVCNGTVNLSATGAANPNTVNAGAATLLTVTVTPAANPTSTGIGVTGNLTAIGGSAAQTFFDNGTNGDQTANDNIFSFSAQIPANAANGNFSLPINVSDAQSRTTQTSIFLTVGTTADGSEHLVMGNPSGATTDINNPFNYLLSKPQYAVSYHRDRAIPNWVSWHLDSSWIGSASRQNDFRPDPQLPSEWYHVTDSDYSGSGFDRGHHTPSGDRTRTVADNSATFLMTNVMPQAAGNNQGPWNNLENFCRSLATQGNELYIIAGSVGTGGIGSGTTVTNTIAGGKVTVPSYTWKVIMILPNGDNDVSRVDTNTRTIAVIMPNNDNIRSDAWQKYLATVDQVEALTGYDFFSNVPTAVQDVIESRLDSASNTSPTTISGGTYTNLDVTAPNATLSGNITVTGNLKLGGSILDTNSNFCVTLGSGATVSRISGYVNGCVEKQFPAISFGETLDSSEAAVGFEYPVGTANGYSPVTVSVTNAAANSALRVNAIQGVQPNVTNPNLALKRYWKLTETGSLTADLTFKYLDADVPAGVSENDFKLQRYEGTFTQIPASINPSANTATAAGISEFSDWTLVATNITTNQPPVANADNYATNEDSALDVPVAQGVLANDTDAENDPLSAIIVAQPTSGALTFNQNGSFTYQPNPNFNGTDSFTYKANDGSTDSNTATVSITINAVNDAPTFAKGADQIVSKNSGAQTVQNWATNISAGAPDEANQTLAFLVTNDNNSLFASQPAISPSGTLTYTPAQNASGLATVTVRLMDNGGTENGGQDTSAPQTFFITITSSSGQLAFNSPTYTVNESDGNLIVTVTRTNGSDGLVTVNYATVAGGTAIGGTNCDAGVDYINASGSVTFGDGVTSQNFSIAICNDSISENSETFNLSLSNATGGAIIGSPNTAVATIVDNVPLPTVSIGNARKFEGNSGTSNMTFSVRLSAASSQTITVNYATANNTAMAGIDYAPNSGTLTFTPGQTVKNIDVIINGDVLKEPNETFFVNLSVPANATIAVPQASGIIIDDDRAYAGDFDRDLRTDFSVFRPGNGFWYSLHSSDNSVSFNQFGLGTDSIAPGDYDGDGRIDLAYFRPSNGTWFILQSSTNTLAQIQLGTNGDIPVAGDYDGDGRTDAAVFRPSTGTWYTSTNPATNYGAIQFGQAGDIPVAGDYDGDGRTDAAVYRNGTWFVLRTTLGFIGLAYGAANDKPVVGDFYGDGKSDFTVYRPLAGTFFTFQSLTNASKATVFGAADDIPATGDYDGDGTTDIAVWRPSNGTFYLLRSSDGAFIGQQWGQSGDIPILSEPPPPLP
ncbi:MAG: DNA/RNA non-specific endonuclease [Pyrinomonadaceae bacterium]